MKRDLIKQSRAGTHVATSPLARVAVALLLLLSNSLTALAQKQGPWMYVNTRSGNCGFDSNNSISYNGLNNTSWGNWSRFFDGDGNGRGTGISLIYASYPSRSKQAFFRR